MRVCMAGGSSLALVRIPESETLDFEILLQAHQVGDMYIIVRELKVVSPDRIGSWKTN